MNAYLCRETALEYWRKNPVAPKYRTVLRSASIDDCLGAMRDLEELNLERWVKPPFRVLVSPASKRRMSAQVKGYSCTRRLPENSFVKIGRGVVVSCPELCFVQMAAVLPLGQLVLLGFELCGTYVLRPADCGGSIACEPLTSVDRLRSYLDRLTRVAGVSNARKAIEYLADGAASPAESIVAALLCMPMYYGGYGLEVPRLNWPYQLGERAARESGRSLCRLDFCWPDAGLCVEYNSDEWHTGSDRIASDAIRTNALVDDGMTVLVVTREQLNSPEKFHDIAHMIAKRLGVRLRIRIRGFERRRANLRRELFSWGKTEEQPD